MMYIALRRKMHNTYQDIVLSAASSECKQFVVVNVAPQTAGYEFADISDRNRFEIQFHVEFIYQILNARSNATLDGTTASQR